MKGRTMLTLRMPELKLIFKSNKIFGEKKNSGYWVSLRLIYKIISMLKSSVLSESKKTNRIQIEIKQNSISNQ